MSYCEKHGRTYPLYCDKCQEEMHCSNDSWPPWFANTAPAIYRLIDGELCRVINGEPPALIAQVTAERDAALTRVKRLEEALRKVADLARKAEAELLSMGATAAVLMAERDAALARAEKSENQHADDASYDASLIYLAQRQAERLAKHALRYRRRTRNMRALKGFAYEHLAKTAEAQRDRLRELLREGHAYNCHRLKCRIWDSPSTCDCGLEGWRARVEKELEGT